MRNRVSPKIYFLIFLLGVSAAVSLASIGFQEIKFFPRLDEGYYLNYAINLSESGFGVFRPLFGDYLGHSQSWVFPSPLRIGYIILGSLSVRFFGNNFFSLAYLSLICYLFYAFFSFYFWSKFFGQATGCLASLLCVFSPLVLAASRRALMDSSVCLFFMLSLWLFFEYSSKRQLSKLAVFLLVFSFTLLLKETAVLLLPIFIIWLFYLRFFKKEKEGFFPGIVSILSIPFAIVISVYLALGVFAYIPEVARVIISSPKTNAYALSFGQGAWFRYLIDFMLISPVIAILAIGYIFIFLAKREKPAQDRFFLLACVVFLWQLNLFTKNVRYAIVLDPLLRVFALFCLRDTLSFYFKKNAMALTAACVLMLIILDCLGFQRIFLSGGIYDPVSAALLQARHLIP